MKLARGSSIVARRSGWLKRTLQAAVVIAVASTVPAAWAAGKSSVKVTNVAAGSAIFKHAGALTTVTTGSKSTIINYQQFDLAAGHTLRFAQPTADSRVLNRIQSTVPSRIDGTITSNGVVYLVNPAGVMFGNGAVINVGKFFAAASNITDANFLKGVNQFTDSAGKIRNEGLIRGQQVHLVGAQVENAGQIVTHGGAGIVTLTAGKDVLIGEVHRPTDLPLITVKISGPASNGGGAAVSNSGTINAGKGQIRMGAGDVYGMALNNLATGVLQGKEITLQGGKGIVQNAGTIDASNGAGHGGQIKLLGEKVAIVDGVLDASGTTGGGRVLIGGDFHGQGTTPTADRTYVGSKATLSADATNSGHGGQVVVWSNELTAFYGKINARGGPQGGNGGQVEVSGKKSLDFTGLVDTSAPMGKMGSLLLDPDIVNFGTNGTDDLELTADQVIALLDGAGLTFNISAATLALQLETAHVTVDAATAINISENVAPTAGNFNLTMTAPTINISGTTNITLRGGNLTLAGNLVLADGANVTLSTLGGGAVTGLVSVTGSISNTVGGANETLAIHGGTGGVSINAVAGGGAGGISNLTIAGETLTLGGTIEVAGAANITSNSTTVDLAVNNSITAGSISLTSGADVTLGATTSLNTAAAGGDVTIRSAGFLVSPGGAISAGTGTVRLFNIDPTQAMSLGGGAGYAVSEASFGAITAGTIIVGESGVQSGALTVIELDASATTAEIVLNSNSGTGGIVLDDGGNSTALDVGGNLVLNAGTGGITAATATNAFAEIDAAGTVALTSGGIIGSTTNRIQFAAAQTDITINAAGDVFLGGLGNIDFATVTSVSGTVNILTTAAGDINATGPISGSTINLNAAGGIGTLVQRVTFVANQQGITLAAGDDIDIDGLGNLTFLSVTSSSGAIDVTTQGGGNIEASGTFSAFSTISLDAAGGIGTSLQPVTFAASQTGVTLVANSNIDVRGLGGLELTSATAGGALAVSTAAASNGDIDVTGTLQGLTVDLTADGDIGSNVQPVTFAAGQTGISLTAGGAIDVDGLGSLGFAAVTAGGTVDAQTAAGGNITATGTVEGTTVTLDAAGGIGSSATPVTIDAGTIVLTTNGAAAAGNIFITTGGAALGTSDLTITTNGAGQLISLVAGAFTVNQDENFTGDNLQIGATSFTLNASRTLTADNFKLVSSGAVTLAGDLIVTGDTRIAGSTVIQSNGSITTTNLAVIATSANGSSEAIKLTAGSNSVTTFAARSTAANGSVALTTSVGGIDLGSLALSPASGGVGAFAAVAGISTNGGNAILDAAPGAAITLDQNIDLGDGVLALDGGLVTHTAGTIIAQHLGVRSTLGINIGFAGTLDLDGASGSGVLAASASAGNIAIRNLTNLNIGTVGPIGGFASLAGVTAAAGNVNLEAAGGEMNGATVSGNLVTLTAPNGIGTAGALAVNATGLATFNTTSASPQGNIRITTANPSFADLDFNTNLATVQIIRVETPGALLLNSNIDAGADTLILHAGTSGIGNLSFAAITITSPNVTLRAGIGDGVANTALVALGTVPTLLTTTTLTIRQDASITDAGIDGSVLVGSRTYTLQSDGGNVTINTAATLAGTNLTLTASSGTGTVFINTSLDGLNTLASLTANGTTELGGNVATTGNQLYNGNLILTSDVALNGVGITFAGTVDSATFQNRSLDVTGAGTILFSDDVGAAIFGELGILTVSGTGTLQLGTGSSLSIETLAGQIYNTPVDLQADVVMNNSIANNITFNNTVDGSQALTVNSANNQVFNAKVGGSVALTSLETDDPGSGILFGSTVFNYASTGAADFSVRTTGLQTYNDMVSLGADTVLASTAAGTITFASSLDGPFDLAVNSAGNEVFNWKVGFFTPLASLTTDNPASGIAVGGQAIFNYNSSQLNFPAPEVTVFTTGTQTYNDNVILGGDTVMESTGDANITFLGTVNATASGVQGLTVITGGITTFNGVVGGLVNLKSLNTDADGTTIFNNAPATTTDVQDFFDDVILVTDTVLTSAPGGSIVFHKTINSADGLNPRSLTIHSDFDTTFHGAIGGVFPLQSLTVTDSAPDFPGGTIRINGGLVRTVGDQTYDYAATLGADTLLESTGGGNINFNSTLDGNSALAVNTSGQTIFNGQVGGSSALLNLTTNAGGATQINGGLVRTTGFQTYNDAVSIGTTAALVHSSGGGNVTFNDTVDGPQSLTVTTAGDTAFNGAVGATTPLESLHTDGGGTTFIRGGEVTTDTTQAYDDFVEIQTLDATLTSNGAGPSGNISFNSTVDGPRALTVNTQGDTLFAGMVGFFVELDSLQTDAGGNTAINGGVVRTVNSQTYNDPVTIGSFDATLSSTGSGNIIFSTTLDGPQGLTVTTGGGTFFNGFVGGADPLAHLTTNGGGNTAISGGGVTTVAFQLYDDTVTITTIDAVLTSNAAGNITFNDTVDGPMALTVNTGGITAFNGFVGGTTPLASLETDAGGSTSIAGGGVTTAGFQLFNDPVILSVQDVILTSTGAGDITFEDTVNGGQALTVNASGLTTFNGFVGGVTPLTSLETDAGGTTEINGGGITTALFQTFNDAVTLGSLDAVLTSNGAGNITFVTTVDGPQALTVNTSGLTTFGGFAGGITPLASVETNIGGTTQINGGGITTVSFQLFNDPVTLAGLDAVLTSNNAGNVTFMDTVNGGQALTVNTDGVTVFNGFVGGIAPLTSVTTDSGGSTTIGGGGITTVNFQTFNDPVNLANQAAVLTSNNAGNITFVTTVNGGQALTVNTSGLTTFGGFVGGTTALTSVETDAGGTTRINGGGITTTDFQLFNDPVTLALLDAVLTSTGGGNVTFVSTVNGAQALTVNTSGITTFGGFVGGTIPLVSVTTDAGGSTAINGGGITTTAFQLFNDPVTLAILDAVLTSTGGGNITFVSTVNGDQALTVNTVGTTTFGGFVGGTTPLVSVTTNAGGTTVINGGGVTTVNFQTFNDPVNLASLDVVLTSTGAGDITFVSTVNGGQALTVNTSGITTFGGFVGGTVALTSVETDAGGSTAINGGGITTTAFQLFNDPVTLANLDAVLTSTGGGDITFVSTVDGAQALTVNTAGATTFGGFVGGSTPLVSVTTNAGGTTTIGGGGITTTAFQLFNDAVLLANLDVVLTSTGGGNINFVSTVDGAQALAVNTSGITAFGGFVGGNTALTSVTTNEGGSTAIIGGGITTSGSQTFNDPVTLAILNAVLSSSGGGNITFVSTLNGGRALTVNTSGVTTFGGAVGGTAALTSLTTDAGGSTRIHGGIVRTTAFQLYNDAVLLGVQNAVLSSTGAGNITFGSTLDGARSLTVNTVGATTFGGAVGGTVALTSLTTNAGGTTRINGGAVTTGASQIYRDPVLLGQNTRLTGYAITFNATLNSSGTPKNLDLFNGSNARFAGPTILGRVAVRGAAGTTSITGPMNVQDLRISNNAQMTGSVVSAAGIAVDRALQASGTLQAGDSITIGVAARLAGNLTAGGEISAPASVTLAGNLVATASGSGIRLGDITGPGSSLRLVTDAPTASKPLIAVGKIGTSAARIGDLEFDSAYVVRLGGDIFASFAKFAGSDRGALLQNSQVATISYDRGDLTINTNGKFIMEQGQKLSVFDRLALNTDPGNPRGNLAIISNNNPIQIGDLAAQGRITINAGSLNQTITIVARPGGEYLKPDGSLATDRGVDIVSGAHGSGPFRLTGTLKVLVPANVKANDLVQFAAQLGSTSLDPTPTFQIDATNTVEILAHNQGAPITAEDFQAPDFITSGIVLDLTAVGVGNPVSSVGAAIQQDFHLLAPERNQAISGALKEALQQLGIYARDLRTDELVEFLIGRSLYDDVPYKLSVSLEDNKIASNRLPYSPVIPVVDAYRALFLKPELDADGNPVLDENGKPKSVPQGPIMQNAFGLAWQLYLEEREDKATPEGFRAFLEANEAKDEKYATALGYLDKLRDLLLQIKALGLTDHELEVSRVVLLKSVRPPTIREADFATAVMGPSTRTAAKTVARVRASS